MEWHKEVRTGALPQRFGRADRITLWGSCFAEELQKHLYQQLYQASFSPYGIMYNPLSMARGMQQLLSGVGEPALFEYDGAWHSPMHHGSYSSTSREEARQRMLTAYAKARSELAETKLWILTFGTSYIYEWAEPPHEVVNNCHRLPAHRFRRKRLTVKEITEAWHPLLTQLRSMGAEVIFTVSPIPHYRDGAHDSRLSKATLLLAIDELLAEGIHYFPSYEIQLDELRDYRFFQEDMAHPTSQAVSYILSRFGDYALEPTPTFDTQWSKVLQLAQHRPLTTDPNKIKAHYTLVKQKLANFAKETSHPLLSELASQIDIQDK